MNNKLSVVFFYIILCNIIGFYSPSLVAQNTPNAGALQREFQLQLERSEAMPTSLPRPPDAARTPMTTDQQVEIRAFTYSGNTLITSNALNEALVKWTNREVQLSELADITSAIQDFYFKNGRLAAANIPPQEVINGVVLIQILEAKLGAIAVDPNDLKAARFSPLRAQKYFLVRTSDSTFINVKNIERSLTLLNEVPGVRAEGAFEPGEAHGYSNFRVRLYDLPLTTGHMAASNYGSSSTGSGQLIANLSVNNPFGLGEQFGFDAIQSLGSTYGQASYSLPVGFDGWRLGTTASYLTYGTLTSWSNTKATGTATSFNLNTTYALLRSQSANTNLRISLDNRNYVNQQLGLTVSDYQITSITAGVAGNFFDTPRSNVSYSAGLVLGSLSMDNINQYAQDTGTAGTAGAYQKLSFSVGRMQALESLPGTTWQISAYGQLATKNLNSAEQLYLGGPYAVRAYPVAQGGGSQGVVFSTELQHRLDRNWQVGVFADIGLIQQYVATFNDWRGLTNADNTYALGAAGITTKFTYETINISAALAMRLGNNPLYTQTGQQLNADNAYRTVQAWLRASWAF
jgi:hemolysin activation/secretion protein